MENGGGSLEARIEQLLTVEKQMRQASDVSGTKKAVSDILDLCFKGNAWKTLNDQIVLLSKRRGQLKQAVTAMVQQAMQYIDQTPDLETRIELIKTLNSVAAGKIYVEIERARLVKKLAKIKEEQGQIAEAADLMRDEDEDGDVGFNPCLEELPSSDGSSILSSEVDGVEASIGGVEIDSVGNQEINSSELTDDMRGGVLDDSEHFEEGKSAQGAPCAEFCEVELKEHDTERLPGGDLEASSRVDEVAFVLEGGHKSDEPDFSGRVGEDTVEERKTSTSLDEEDAIFKRTRARYSLAGFTLEELESFLQETDDDDDLRNVDDEEEYRKFLAAVLGGGDGDSQLAVPNEVVDDEDEDNDADFEIELEEALESDLDETLANKNLKGGRDRFGRRPETRQNRRQKVNGEQKRKLLELGRRPLRPLLPLLPVGYDVPSTSYSLRGDTPNHTSFPPGSGFMNGFTPHQLGQLYCLIHEHVQLLIQIYSLCILDSSRQQIASTVQELLFEVLQKQKEALARRSTPYPAFCFFPPYVLPTVPNQPCRLNQMQHSLGSHPSLNAQTVGSSPTNQMQTVLHDSPISEQGRFGDNGSLGSHSDDGAVWFPFVSGPVLSILDIAPLHLVKNYIQNVTVAVRENHRRRVESSFDFRSEREPLFPLPICSSTTGGDKQVSKGSGQTGSSSPSQQQLKRSLATALVESTKKQSVALVPREIAKLAQIFYPLFNKALFPHKPPPASVTNRILFTDAEDELLALGMMEYNTDWKAIQQRFIPCKSKHQIFVRQKNRCSSKAPENPIKAVRRMKTSPLTAEEMQYIQEGLKIYKLDWMSVWKYVVPHRDPSLLPRQWRIAMGIQKSYKVDPAKKQKRCKYEAERRRRAAMQGAGRNASEEDHNARGENSSGDDCVDDPDEAYVHEAFLANWTPDAQGTNDVGGKSIQHIYGEGQNQAGDANGLPFASSYVQAKAASHPQGSCTSSSVVDPVMCRIGRTSIPPLSNRPRKGCQVESARLVKLAPNLPPVNLPQNVRVISASAYHHSRAGFTLPTAEAHADQSVFKSSSHRSLQVEGPEMGHVRNTNNYSSMDDDGACLESEEPAVNHEKRSTGKRGSCTGIPMHPLLFQAPENPQLPYYMGNSGSLASTPLNFFSPSPPQLNLSLFHNSPRRNQVMARFFNSPRPGGSSSLPDGIDFHPLLERTDSASTEMIHKQPWTELPARLGVPQSRKQAAGSSLPALENPSNHGDKSSEIDLSIHLNSITPRRTAERSDEDTPKRTWHVGDRTPVDPQERRDPSCDEPENFALISFNPPGTVGTHTDDVDIVGDQSNPGIVMEQEELSDSEEDIEENVEFECEEMADSDGEEESDAELAANMPNQAVQHPELGKPFTAANNGHKHEGSKTICNENLEEGCVAPLSSRPRKRTRPNSKCDAAMLHNQLTGCTKPEDLDQGFSAGSLRRPRKRSCGKNSSSNSVKAVENSNFPARGTSTD
ncbi:hypothetical protein MLD38_021451 [Melastoma candidum]|uniref:Uncharacterized protein n=1 Tax=Melastoma candidum TaxID=119954 RepID=A0ACB9QGN2_9MYRT|nr:hypothetical protein MLD38_021451 [Melastoma candidum]